MVKTEWENNANNEIRRGISQKELAEWDAELDGIEAGKPTTVPITVADLPPEAQAAGEEWRRARLWSWIDAIAWIARPGPELITLIWAYRDLASRRWPDVEVVERACRTVLMMHLREPAVALAERQLKAWCRTGALEAVSIPSGAVIPQVDWHAGREPIASDIPLVLLPTAALRQLSPIVPVADAVELPELPNAAPSPRRVAQARVEAWFREVRCPTFEGQPPPNWQSCWQAAKDHFAPDRVVREVLLGARREVAPVNWQKSGPRPPGH